jgi:NADH-quinone oxidoreductase subunit M
MMLLSLFMWPALAAVFLFCFGRFKTAAQVSNIVFNLVWAGLLYSFYMGAHGQIGSNGFWGETFSWAWMSFLKSKFLLGVDGLSFSLIALNVLLSLCLSLYALGHEKLDAAYLGLFSLLNSAAVGSLLSLDALTFYCFWEFMLIPMYLLIGRWGSKERVYAALKFFAFTMGGSLLMLLAILALAFASQSPSLAWADLIATRIPFTGWSSLGGLCFLGFLAAFVVKIPLWPFHTWLPDAHTEAPTGGSVILAGVLLKLGVYGMARWCLPLFPGAAAAAAPAMITLALLGIVLGAFAAWKQTDIKRMIAYSSVSHLGFMVLGLFVLTPQGLQGAMFQNIAHGLSTGTLFLLFGMIYDRTHTRQLADYGGLATVSGPVATVFVFASMASVGLPGLPGFIGEFLVISGSYLGQHKWAAVFALSGVLLSAVYTLTLLRKMVFGPVGATLIDHKIRLKWSEWFALAPLVLAMIYFGLQPQSLLNFAQGPIDSILMNAR